MEFHRARLGQFLARVQIIPVRTFTVCISFMLVLTRVTDELPRLLCLSDGAKFVLCQYSPGLPKKCDGNVKKKKGEEKKKRYSVQHFSA